MTLSAITSGRRALELDGLDRGDARRAVDAAPHRRYVDGLFEDRFLVGVSAVRVASRPRVETPGTEDTAL